MEAGIECQCIEWPQGYIERQLETEKPTTRDTKEALRSFVQPLCPWCDAFEFKLQRSWLSQTAAPTNATAAS